jgi:hypothetical protein
MKVTTEETNRDKDIKYPCIMIHKEDPDIIMLMIREKNDAYEGVPLVHPYISYWDKGITKWNMDLFVPMKGKVILEND